MSNQPCHLKPSMVKSQTVLLLLLAASGFVAVQPQGSSVNVCASYCH